MKIASDLIVLEIFKPTDFGTKPFDFRTNNVPVAQTAIYFCQTLVIRQYGVYETQPVSKK